MEYLRMLEVTYLGATYTKGPRLKIYDHKYEEAVHLPRNYNLDIEPQILEFFKEHGIEIKATCNTRRGVAYLTANYDTKIKEK